LGLYTIINKHWNLRPSSRRYLRVNLVKSNRAVEANRTIAELKTGRPEVATRALGMLPFAKATDREHFVEGLHLAGLSET
jgi:hypothetical protein